MLQSSEKMRITSLNIRGLVADNPVKIQDFRQFLDRKQIEIAKMRETHFNKEVHASKIKGLMTNFDIYSNNEEKASKGTTILVRKDSSILVGLVKQDIGGRWTFMNIIKNRECMTLCNIYGETKDSKEDEFFENLVTLN